MEEYALTLDQYIHAHAKLDLLMPYPLLLQLFLPPLIPEYQDLLVPLEHLALWHEWAIEHLELENHKKLIEAGFVIRLASRKFVVVSALKMGETERAKDLLNIFFDRESWGNSGRKERIWIDQVRVVLGKMVGWMEEEDGRVLDVEDENEEEMETMVLAWVEMVKQHMNLVQKKFGRIGYRQGSVEVQFDGGQSSEDFEMEDQDSSAFDGRQPKTPTPSISSTTQPNHHLSSSLHIPPGAQPCHHLVESSSIQPSSPPPFPPAPAKIQAKAKRPSSLIINGQPFVILGGLPVSLTRSKLPMTQTYSEPIRRASILESAHQSFSSLVSRLAPAPTSHQLQKSSFISADDLRRELREGAERELAKVPQSQFDGLEQASDESLNVNEDETLYDTSEVEVEGVNHDGPLSDMEREATKPFDEDELGYLAQFITEDLKATNHMSHV